LHGIRRERDWPRQVVTALLSVTLLLSLYLVLKVHYSSPMVIFTYNRLSHATRLMGYSGAYPIDTMATVSRLRPAPLTIARLRAFVSSKDRTSCPEFILASHGTQLLLSRGSSSFIHDCLLLPQAIVYLPAIGTAGALLLLCAHRMYTAGRGKRAAKKGVCVCCGYDLTGNQSGRCPECGCATKLGKGGLHDGTAT